MKNKILLLLFFLTAVCIIVSYSRISTALSIEKKTDYKDYNLYEMDIKYNYDLDRVISHCAANDQSYINAVLSEVLPFVKVDIAVPDFSCSSFNSFNTEDLHYKMGRNFDFEPNTSVMLVRCNPKNGYSSIALAPLVTIQMNHPEASVFNRLVCLTSPFDCVDGINEKGVSISVLSLDGKPTRQNTGKPVLYTNLAVRLVLDRAASTAEAVDLLSKYDMFAAANVDYHFYITDSKGDGRVVEFNLEKENRDIMAIESSYATNFYLMYRDSIQSYHTDLIFSHGRDRYNAMDSLFKSHPDNVSDEICWETLKTVSRGSKPDELTYVTQWSALYDNTSCDVAVVVHRDWKNIYKFGISK